MSELFEFDGLRKFFQTGFRMVFERRIRFNPVHADISNRDLHYRFQLDLTAKVTAAGSAADDSPARLILVARACPWRSTRRRAVFVDSECEDLQIGATLHLLVQFFQVGQLSFAGTAPGRLDINQDGPASEVLEAPNLAGEISQFKCGHRFCGLPPPALFDRLEQACPRARIFSILFPRKRRTAHSNLCHPGSCEAVARRRSSCGQNVCCRRNSETDR